MPDALVPIVVGVGSVRPRAEPTSAAVGHDNVVVVEVEVAVDVEAVAVGVAVPVAVPAADDEPVLALPQAAITRAPTSAAPAAKPRRRRACGEDVFSVEN
jgi:hypothetical protein